MSQLFSPLKLRGLAFKNRIFVSPMCQYSSRDGFPNDWHLVHLGSRAVGGAALVLSEATAVAPVGRISPADTGIWSDAHAQAFQPITAFLKAQGAVPGIQLAHAGRKASVDAPFRGGQPLTPDDGGWLTVAPSAVPFGHFPAPRALTVAEIETLIEDFTEAARRSLAAGFEVVEVHMAHGYLLHQFLSPLANQRTDAYGGDFAGRTRLPLQVGQAVRAVWPDHLPVFVRISASDWAAGGWDLEQSIEFAQQLRAVGVDLIDCSSGGLLPGVHIPLAPGYQVSFAAQIRQAANLPTGAVGLITEPQQAEQIIAEGQADAVLLARALLRDPYWPLHAARVLGADIPWPLQYERAKL